MRERYSQPLRTPEMVDYFIRRLIEEQRRELDRRKFPNRPLNTRKKIFTWFKESSVFEEIYQEALNFNAEPRSDQQIQINLKHLAGRIFEEMAYSYLSNIQSPARLILSPQKTRLFFKGLLSQQPIVNPYGLDSLPTPPPDGLIIESLDGKHKFAVFCEYTLFVRRSRFEKKIEQFNQIQSDFFPDLFADASLLFVLPRTTCSLHFSGVEIESLPFTPRQFRNYIDGLYQRFQKDSRSATLDDIQEEARSQLSRAITRFEEGALTPEQAEYLSKRGITRTT